MPSTTFDTSSQPARGLHQRLSPAPCVVLLNGFPGIGKFTVAKTVSERMENYGFPHRLIRTRNQDPIDPEEALEPFRKAAQDEFRKSIPEIALEGPKDIDDPSLILVFTVTLSSSDEPKTDDGLAQLKKYVELAKARKVPLVFINLLCDQRENVKRLCEEKRKHGSNTKLVDVGTLQKIRSVTTLIGREEVLACRDDITTVYLDLDISKMDLEEEREAVWEVLCQVK